MSNAVPTRPRVVGQRRTFVLVASLYNAKFVQGLVDHCSKELMLASPNSTVILHQVPGAFEIPIVVQEIAVKGGVDAIIALGVILQGETRHADHIAAAITHSFQQIALQTKIPVIHEVLSVLNEEQARKRCIEDELNRGTEAARVAIEVSQLLSDLRENKR